MSTTQVAPAQPPNNSGKMDEGSATGEPLAEIKPFVGLVPLDVEDAKRLAGREDEVRTLTTNLRAARLTLVYGASGAGKSSLLRAGVIATLRAQAKKDLDNFGAPTQAVAIMNSWAGDLFIQLAESAREAIKQALEVETIPPLPISKDKDLVETLRMWTNSFGLELLIVLDQFEEVFLYHEKEEGPGTFLYELPRAINASDLRVHFLLSLRDDSLFKLDRFQSSLPSLFETRLQVFPLTAENAEQAIRKAIAVYNETQPAGDQVDIEKALIDKVLEQVSTDVVHGDASLTGGPEPHSPSQSYIDAPYMQLVMARLWDAENAGWQKNQPATRVLRLATLTRLGSAQAVVEQHLDRLMHDFSKSERHLASDCFYRLVTPGGSKIALTPEELEKWAHHPAPEIEAFLEKLVAPKYRILRRVDKKGLDGSVRTAYQAHHDRIALAMRGWQERYKAKRVQKRNVLIMLGVFALVVIFILAGAYKRSSNALAAKEQIEEEVRTSETDERLLQSLVPKFICKINDPMQQPDVDKIKRILHIDCEPVALATPTPEVQPGTEVQLPPRIYIQIQDEAQREAAERLRQILLGERYNWRKPSVPGIQYVGSRTLETSQLRYFHKADPTEIDFAWLIVTSLKKICVDVGAPVYVRGYEDSTKIRPRHFELWLTPDALYRIGCNAAAAE